MSDWYLYLVRTGEGSLYAGITTDVERRLAEHRGGGARCARALRGRGPLEQVYSTRIGDRSLALRAEHRLKQLPKSQKEAIVDERPSCEKLIERLALEDG